MLTKHKLLHTASAFVLTLSACTSDNAKDVKAELNTNEKSIESFLGLIDESLIYKNTTREIIFDLSVDKLNGRLPNTAGFEYASEYVEKFLKANDIKPFFKSGFRDPVSSKGDYTSANIVGLIGDYDRTKPHVIISAHLDHIGTDKNNSSEDVIYNGANDNASGVTAVLQIAKELNKNNYNKNIIIALFTEEETGLVGSTHLAKKLNQEGLNLAYMLNFEMIGKPMVNIKNVYITGDNISNLAEVMNKANNNEKFVEVYPAAHNNHLFYSSDNYSFYKEFKVPCHTISTFDFDNYHDHYHKVTDEYRILDMAHMNKIIKTSATIIDKMLEDDVDVKLNNNGIVKPDERMLSRMHSILHNHE